ncbi:MAG TPA: hypothetical protein VMW41_05910 [Candidatus Bathyarchaeia archaeon]|nr:hypothetical protein [Candidatus Bathyarchaeia archaeon]
MNEQTVTVENDFTHEGLKHISDANTYLRVILTTPIGDLKQRRAMLRAEMNKYPTISQERKQPEYVHWEAECQELTDIAVYKRQLADNRIISLEPGDLEKACLEVCLKRLVDPGICRCELTYLQCLWLTELMTKLGTRHQDCYYAPFKIVYRLTADITVADIRRRGFGREQDLQADLRTKAKWLRDSLSNHYRHFEIHPNIGPKGILAAVLAEEKSRQEQEASRPPGKVPESAADQPSEADELVPPLSPRERDLAEEELYGIIDELGSLRARLTFGKITEDSANPRIALLEARKKVLTRRLGFNA